MGLTGRERAERVRQYARLYGISKQVISAIVRKVGQRGRQAVRRDRGGSGFTREQALLVAAVVKASRRVDGRIPMPQKEAVRLLAQTGQLETDRSYSTICRELRRHALSKADLKRPTPHRPRASAHPNFEMQVDFTACHQWYKDDDGALTERDVATALHKNHPEEFRKIRRHYWQITAVDQFSGAFFFQYVYASGETAQDAIEFLIQAMQPKGHPAYTFHGIPARILTDNGAFGKSPMAKRFCRLFGIDLKTHLPGNPRAKGSVETHHNLLEQFNARLKLQPPRDEDELNRRAFDFCVEVNCTRPFRAKIDGRGRTRMQWWSEIRPEQLFVPPPAEVCRELIRTGPLARTVEGSGRLRYKGRVYHVPDVNVWGRSVEVAYNPRAYPEVEVTWRDYDDHHVRAVWSLTPLELLGGFLSDSVRPGDIRRPAATITQQAEGEMEQIAEERWGLTHKGSAEKRIAVAPATGAHRIEWFGFDADGADNLVTRPTPGTLRTPADPAAERRLTVMGLLGELAEGLGRPLTRDENARIRAAWPAGCRMSEIDAIMDGLHGDRREGHDARQISAG
ncbi:MAG: transposase family protein [Candidatus Methylomirabilis oxyfera]|nr:transposase family protein [Candidatus Methylomirabilis oxyfera]